MLRFLKPRLYLGLKQLKHSQLASHQTWFKQNQYLPYVTLQQYQRNLLSQLLNAAYQYIPEYQSRLEQAGVIRNQIINFDQWPELMPLTRQDLSERKNRFINPNAEENGIYFASTGGSTGTPVYIAQDEAYRAWSQAAYFFYNEWSGLHIGTPYFLLWASEQDLSPQCTSLREKLLQGFLQGRRILDCSLTSPEIYASLIRQINRQKDCVHMIGYAKELHALATFSIENKMPINRSFKAVYSTAERLTTRMRKTIEEVFQCKVFNRYGARDVGDVACECHFQRGLHINPLFALIEVVDQDMRILPYGEEGQILVTNFHNHAMPLLRYAIGDRGILQAPRRCECGREWETLTCITGRTNEKILLPNGRQFNGIFVEEAFDYVPSIRGYQLKQIAPAKLLIRLSSHIENYADTHAPDLEALVHRLQTWTQYPLQIEFEQTDDFEKTPTGKQLTIIPFKGTRRQVPQDSPELILTS